MIIVRTSGAHGPRSVAGVALLILLAGAAPTQSRARSAANQAPAPMTVSVHETAPTEQLAVAEARIDVTEGALVGQVFSSDRDGRVVLPVVALPVTLTIQKAGYDTTRVRVTDIPPDGRLAVTMMPELRDVNVKRGGSNACTDLPAPPDGVDGLREYARIAVHHDGVLTVRSAQLPFFSNPGYVYRQTASGWARNEVDYVLLRSPIPVRGGFVYLITFGGDREQCGSWSVDLTHPV